MKKPIAFVLVLVFISSTLLADDMKIYIELFDKGKYKELYEHLVNWEKK